MTTPEFVLLAYQRYLPQACTLDQAEVAWLKRDAKWREQFTRAVAAAWEAGRTVPEFTDRQLSEALVGTHNDVPVQAILHLLKQTRENYHLEGESDPDGPARDRALSASAAINGVIIRICQEQDGKREGE